MISSSERVTSHTAESANQQIQRLIQSNVLYYTMHPDQIDQRLGELDQEWDIERTLQANAATLTLVGTVFGALFGRKWRILPLVVGGFLLQHAIQGWCPPLSLLRGMGIRTQQEIDQERYALKAVRGDFKGSEEQDPIRRSAQVLDAVHP